MFITRLRPLFLYDIPERPGTDPAPATPETPASPEAAAAAAPGTDWETIAKEHQAWGTRLAQEKATLEQEAQLARALRSQDPGERQQALQQLGLALIDDDPAAGAGGQLYDELSPDVQARLAKVDELEQWRDQTTSQQQQQADYAAYRQITDPELKTLGVPDGLHDVIAEAALNLPAVQTPQGPKPDLQGAWDQFAQMADQFAAIPAVQTAVKKAWADSKPNRALTTPAGQAGTETHDLTTHDGRMAYALGRIQAERG